MEELIEVDLSISVIISSFPGSRNAYIINSSLYFFDQISAHVVKLQKSVRILIDCLKHSWQLACPERLSCFQAS